MGDPSTPTMLDVNISAATCKGGILRLSKKYQLTLGAPASTTIVGIQSKNSDYVKFASDHVLWNLPFGSRFTVSSSCDVELIIGVERSRRFGLPDELIGSCVLKCPVTDIPRGPHSTLARRHKSWDFDHLQSDPEELTLSLESQNEPVDASISLTFTISPIDARSGVEGVSNELSQLVLGPPPVMSHPLFTNALVTAFVSQSNAWKVLLDRLDGLIHAMDMIAEVHPWLKLAWGVVSVAYKVTSAQVELDAKIGGLVRVMADTCSFADEADPLKKYSKHGIVICKIMQQVVECTYFVKAYCQDKTFVMRTLKNMTLRVDQQIQDYKNHLSALRDGLEKGLLLDTTVMIHRVFDNLDSVKDVIEDTDARVILQDLRYAEGARRNFNNQCLPETRMEVVDSIIRWAAEAANPGAELPKWDGLKTTAESRVLWLCGVSGSGKSTIARSVAARLEGMKRLGSFYAFDRSCSRNLNPSTLFCTIARDLADRDPIRKRSLVNIIRDMTSKRKSSDCVEQFENLIIAPASGLTSFGNTVIVIDAFDESGTPAERKEILSILTNRARELPDGLRIIVTSRFETDVQKAMERASSAAVNLLLLRDVPDTLTRRDIETYVYRSLQQDLPPKRYGHLLDQLSRKAELSFQWACTACRLITIADDGDGAASPEDRIQRVLESDDGLDELYRQIMDGHFHKSDPQTLAPLNTVLGIMVNIVEPLPLRALAELATEDDLMDDHQLEQHQRSIRHLASVVDGSHNLDTLITPLHSSFADFLRDPSRGGKYSSDPKNIEKLLALRCLRTMGIHLRFNICHLPTSFKRHKDVNDIGCLVAKNIPHLLSYACRFWPHHVAKLATIHSNVIEEVDVHFRRFFLQWLEVVSLLIDAPQVILSPLINMVFPSSLETLIAAAVQYTSMLCVPIKESVPHIYLSIPFVPSSSVLRQALPDLPGAVILKQGKMRFWSTYSRILHGHTNTVTSVAFSPKGTQFASGSTDLTIRIWDTSTWSAVGKPLIGHTNDVNCISISPDGKYLASGSDDLTIRIWDMANGALIGDALCGHVGAVNSVAFSPDGTKLVSGAADQTVRIWDVSTRQMILAARVGADDERGVRCVAFSPDAYRLTFCSGNGACFWDVATGAAIGPHLVGKSSMTSVAFSPEGQRILSGCDDGSVLLWDITSAQIIWQSFGDSSGITCVAFSPNGMLAASSSDSRIHVWNAETGLEAREAIVGHNSTICAIAFSPDSRRLISGSEGHSVRVWDVQSPDVDTRQVKQHIGNVNSVAFSPDGALVASGSSDGSLYIWDAATGTTVGEPLKVQSTPITHVLFSPDSKTLISRSGDWSIRMWDVKVSTAPDSSGDHITVGLLSTNWDCNNAHILTCFRDGTVQKWDRTTGQELKRLPSLVKVLPDPYAYATFSSTSALIAFDDVDETLCVWNMEISELFGTLQGHTSDISCAAFSPDGALIVLGSHDTTVRIWEVGSGATVGSPLHGHTSPISCITFSPDGTHIASGSLDRTIRIWDVKTGTMVGDPLKGHTDTVSSIAFSRDGKQIVSGSADCTVRIWDVWLSPAISSSTSSNSNSNPALERTGTSIIPWDTYQYPPSLFPNHDFGVTKDGWILGPNDELVLWIPHPHRLGLRGPGVRILGRPVTELDFSNFKCGTEWEKCRDPVT